MGGARCLDRIRGLALVVGLLAVLLAGAAWRPATVGAAPADPLVGRWAGIDRDSFLWVEVAPRDGGYAITVLTTIEWENGCNFYPGDTVLVLVRVYEGDQTMMPMVIWRSGSLVLERSPGTPSGRPDGCVPMPPDLTKPYSLSWIGVTTENGREVLSLDVSSPWVATTFRQDRSVFRFRRAAAGESPGGSTTPTSPTTPTTPTTPATPRLRVALTWASVRAGRLLEVRYRVGTTAGVVTRETFTIRRGTRLVARMTSRAGRSVWGTPYRISFRFARRLPSGPLRLCVSTTASGGGRAGPSCLLLR